MDKVLLSAFACDPSKGSEPGNGWNWASGLVEKGFEVHCLTRITGKKSIESINIPPNLTFHYVILPFQLEKLYTKGAAGMYLYYLLWQWVAYRKAVKLSKKHSFKVAHHVTWGSIQMGSFFYKLHIPFIFGPSGGGQKAPVAFKEYFLEHWGSEIKREKISSLMQRYNPAFKAMLKKARVVLVSNVDTLELAKANGAQNTMLTLDAALPVSFFPENFVPKKPSKDKLQLLWVGRFMARKGLLLLLDVMKDLKQYTGITLTVIGDGEMKGNFVKTIDDYKLQDTVIWKGKVPFEQVKEYYDSHDAFLFASLRDSCPAQLVEAMAFGLPIITINLHGQALIVNDQTGIRCAHDNPQVAINSLKEAILHLYSNPATVEAMSVEAHNFALKQTWNSKISTIVDLHYPL